MNLKWVKSLPGTTAGKNIFKEAEEKNLIDDKDLEQKKT